MTETLGNQLMKHLTSPDQPRICLALIMRTRQGLVALYAWLRNASSAFGYAGHVPVPPPPSQDYRNYRNQLEFIPEP